MSKCLQKCTHAHGRAVDGFMECSALGGHLVQIDSAANCTDYELHTVTAAAVCPITVQEAISRARAPDPATGDYARKAAAARRKRMNK